MVNLGRHACVTCRDWSVTLPSCHIAAHSTSIWKAVCEEFSGWLLLKVPWKLSGKVRKAVCLAWNFELRRGALFQKNVPEYLWLWFSKRKWKCMLCTSYHVCFLLRFPFVASWHEHRHSIRSGGQRARHVDGWKPAQHVKPGQLGYSRHVRRSVPVKHKLTIALASLHTGMQCPNLTTVFAKPLPSQGNSFLFSSVFSPLT